MNSKNKTCYNVEYYDFEYNFRAYCFKNILSLFFALGLLFSLVAFSSMVNFLAAQTTLESRELSRASGCRGERSAVQLADFRHDELVRFTNVQRTDKLEGVTRMAGNCMVLFDLEVLSVTPNSSPGEGSILAEIKSSLFLETGVLAGMSGSPVYLDKKLVGAVAYTVQNLRKPIVGITPIHAMLRIKDYLPKENQRNQANQVKPNTATLGNIVNISNAKVFASHNAVVSQVALFSDYGVKKVTAMDSQRFVQEFQGVTGDNFFSPTTMVFYGDRAVGKLLANFGNQSHLKNWQKLGGQFLSRQFSQVNLRDDFSTVPIPITLSIRFAGEVRSDGAIHRDRLRKFFNPSTTLLTQLPQEHFQIDSSAPVITAGDPSVTNGTTPIKFAVTAVTDRVSKFSGSLPVVIPGDLIGVNLVRGDMDISAYGTVTHVDGDLVYAFGHPMDLLGPTSMPMYKAFVDAVVPRTDFSYKVGSLVAEMGAVVEDRKTAILGVRGKASTYVPINVELATKDNQKALRFEVVKGLDYGPGLMATLVAMSVEQYESQAKRSPFGYAMTIDLKTKTKTKMSDRISNLVANPTTNFKEYTLEFSKNYPYQPLEFSAQQMASEVFRTLRVLQENPFAEVDFTSISVKMQDDGASDFWEMDRVELSKTSFSQGEPIAFKLHLKSYRGKNETLALRFSSARLSSGVHFFSVSSKEFFTQMDRQMNRSRFRPENFNQFVEQLQETGGNNELVVATTTKNPAHRFNDQIYRNLPHNALEKLSRVPSTKKDVLREYVLHEVKISRPIFGSLSFAIEIETPE